MTTWSKSWLDRSALSYYVAVIIGGSYFLSKRCVFSFSTRRIRWRKIRELLAGGVPTVIGMASTVVLVFAVNRLLLDMGGKTAVAAYAVITSVCNGFNCISTGIGGVALTLSGVLYNDEDRAGLSDLLRLIGSRAVRLGLVAMVLLMALAEPLAGLFIPGAGQSRALAIPGLRMFALGLIPCCLSNGLRNCYQGTGRVGLMQAISVMANMVLPTLAAWALGKATGLRGCLALLRRRRDAGAHGDDGLCLAEERRSHLAGGGYTAAAGRLRRAGGEPA